MQDFEANKKFIEEQANILKALGHPTRLWIIQQLMNGEKCVCDFVKVLPYDFSTISKHLAVLKKYNIVSVRKQGKERYYKLKMKCIVSMLNCLREL